MPAHAQVRIQLENHLTRGRQHLTSLKAAIGLERMISTFQTMVAALLLAVVPGMTAEPSATPTNSECPYICDATAESAHPTPQTGCSHISWLCSPALDGTSDFPCGLQGTCTGCAQSCTWVVTLNGCTQVAWKWQGPAAQGAGPGPAQGNPGLRGYCGTVVVWRIDVDEDGDGLYDDNWLKHTLECKCP
jgi:hypothetical protein